MRRFWQPLSYGRKSEVMAELGRASTPGLDFFLMVVLSCVIATLGLIINSGTVVIGAMLVAPLMSPILGISLSTIIGDASLFRKSLEALLKGILLAVAISAALGLLASTGEFNFLAELPSEILGRTRPTLFDLAIAIAGGTAAAYALSQPHMAATLPGVAIATALMPPLCVVGIGLSQRQRDVFGGALLLFLANLVAIGFAGSLVFYLLGFGPLPTTEQVYKIPRTIAISIGLLFLVALPLSGFMFRIIGEAQENMAIRTVLNEEVGQIGGLLVSFEKRWERDHLALTAIIRSSRDISHEAALKVQTAVATRLQKPTSLVLVVVPVTMLDPLIPPTFTPTPLPGATPTPTPTLTATPTSSPTATSTSMPTSTSTATLMPTPTATSTATPTLTPSPTPTPTVSSTATPVYAVVGATDRRGANMRRHPGLSPVVEAWPDGTVMLVLGQEIEADGFTWVLVRDPEGRVGWMAQDFLVPYYP
jgi:uncharacterized hydrophobic protein (TIGR00271 family)